MKSNCITGVTLNEGDLVRVVFVVENNVLDSNLTYSKADKPFKVVGLPFPATYHPKGLFKADYSSQLEVTKKSLVDFLKLDNSVISSFEDFILSVRNGDFVSRPFQANAFLSYFFIDETAYQMLLKEEGAFGQFNFKYHEKYNEVFKDGLTINVENNIEGHENNIELNKLLTGNKKLSYYSCYSAAIEDHFIRASSLMTKCEEKNRDHLINALYAFDVLEINGYNIKPFSSSFSEQKLSIMYDIQETSLHSYDKELFDFCPFSIATTYTIKEEDFKKITGINNFKNKNSEISSDAYPEMLNILPSHIKTFFVV